MNNTIFCLRISLFAIGYFYACERMSAQNYFDQLSIVPPGSLLEPPSEKIVGFSNSPWPTYNAHAIRVQASMKAVEKFLSVGKPIPPDETSWDQAAKVKFTLPDVTYAGRPHLRELELNGDPTLYSVYCQGVLATQNNKIYFWRILNDRYLLLSDGKNYCMLKADNPILIGSFQDSDPSTRTSDVMENQAVKAILEHPLLMRREPFSETLSISEVGELFETGRWIRFSIPLQADVDPLGDVLLPMVIEEMKKSDMSSNDLEMLRRFDEWGLELNRQTGAILLKNEAIFFWRVLSADVLEIRQELDETIFVIKR